MSLKGKLTKLIKGFGWLYFLLNIAIVIVTGLFAMHGMINRSISPGFIVIILPVMGIFAGYWMRLGRNGWWRNLIIVVSLVLSGAIVVTAVIVSPEMRKREQKNFERHQKSRTSNPEVQMMFSALYENDLDTVRQQLEKGVNVNAKDDTGLTPLHITQNRAIAQMLIGKGADVNAVDPENMTPIFNKEVELSKILVEAGADINFKSNKGNTPMIWYAYSGYMEGIQYLVSLGAAVNVINSDGQTAYDVAEKFGHFKLLEYFKSIGAKKGDR